MKTPQNKPETRKTPNKPNSEELGDRFWEEKPLAEMNEAEWEALCDGCGACCLIQLEDEDTGERVFTKVACTLLDIGSCKCKDYENRFEKVPGCSKVTLDLLKTADWLPPTCAYRRLYDGKPLYWWHPLISGDPATVKEAGVSIKGWARSEDNIHPDEIEEKYLAPNLFKRFEG